MADRIEQLTEALQRIKQWSEAYPLDVFPEPDLKRAHAVLKEHGMTLDAISAHVMRHALRGVGRIAAEALTMPTPEPPFEDEARDVDRHASDARQRDDKIDPDRVAPHGR